MRNKSLARAFVVTLSATVGCSAGCSGPEKPVEHTDHVNPPPPDDRDPGPPTSAQPSAQPAAQPSAQPAGAWHHPRSKDGRLIHLGWNEGDPCYVYEDFPPLKTGETRYPGTEPPRRTVDCPAAFEDKAYQSCRGGTLRKQGDTCECFIPGNPPLVRPNDCPS